MATGKRVYADSTLCLTYILAGYLDENLQAGLLWNPTGAGQAETMWALAKGASSGIGCVQRHAGSAGGAQARHDARAPETEGEESNTA